MNLAYLLNPDKLCCYLKAFGERECGLAWSPGASVLAAYLKAHGFGVWVTHTTIRTPRENKFLASLPEWASEFELEIDERYPEPATPIRAVEALEILEEVLR